MHHLFHIILAANPNAVPANGIVPLGTKTIGGGINDIIKIALQIIGSLSIVFIVIGGLMMVLSAGNPAHIKQARETIQYAVIGLIVAISAYAVVTFVTGHL